MPTLTWLGQAGFLLEGADRRCLFDPFLTDGPDRLVSSPLAVEELPPLSAVFVSHEHGDHFDAEALLALLAVQPDVRIVVPEPLVDILAEAGPGGHAVVGSRPGADATAGGVPFRSVPAMHGVEPADAYGFGDGGLERPRFQGYVVELDGVRLYHAGDTLAWDGLGALLRDLRVDVALLPVNGRDPEREAAGIVGNMDHREAVSLAVAAGCRVLVPMHYGMFASNTVDPRLAVEHARAAQPDLEVRLPVPGEPITV